MSKGKQVEATGLDVASEVTEKTSTKKVQTQEDKETLVAGVELLVKMGVPEKLAKVLPLVPEWNGEKENLQSVKEAVIESFEGSEKLKDYFDTEFAAEVQAFQGIAKAMPVLNNIKAFYARRESTKKAKLVQILISGTIYMVNSAYMAETASMPAEERKQLILSHADTKKADVAEELL